MDCVTATLPRNGSGMSRLEACLAAAVRWLYQVVQPADALVDPRGAQMLLPDGYGVRVVPTGGVAGTPLILVDHHTPSLSASGRGTELATLPASLLEVLAAELSRVGIDPDAVHYHLATGVVAIDVPAHPSLRAAVARYPRSCRQHQTRTSAVGVMS